MQCEGAFDKLSKWKQPAMLTDVPAVSISQRLVLNFVLPPNVHTSQNKRPGKVFFTAGGSQHQLAAFIHVPFYPQLRVESICVAPYFCSDLKRLKIEAKMLLQDWPQHKPTLVSTTLVNKKHNLFMSTTVQPGQDHFIRMQTFFSLLLLPQAMSWSLK